MIRLWRWKIVGYYFEDLKPRIKTLEIKVTDERTKDIAVKVIKDLDTIERVEVITLRQKKMEDFIVDHFPEIVWITSILVSVAIILWC